MEGENIPIKVEINYFPVAKLGKGILGKVSWWRGVKKQLVEIKFEPYSPLRRETIAHELIHVKTPKFIQTDILPYKLRPQEIISFGLQKHYAKSGFKVTPSTVKELKAIDIAREKALHIKSVILGFQKSVKEQPISLKAKGAFKFRGEVIPVKDMISGGGKYPSKISKGLLGDYLPTIYRPSKPLVTIPYKPKVTKQQPPYIPKKRKPLIPTPLIHKPTPYLSSPYRPIPPLIPSIIPPPTYTPPKKQKKKAGELVPRLIKIGGVSKRPPQMFPQPLKYQPSFTASVLNIRAKKASKFAGSLRIRPILQ